MKAVLNGDCSFHARSPSLPSTWSAPKGSAFRAMIPCSAAILRNSSSPSSSQSFSWRELSRNASIASSLARSARLVSSTAAGETAPSLASSERTRRIRLCPFHSLPSYRKQRPPASNEAGRTAVTVENRSMRGAYRSIEVGRETMTRSPNFILRSFRFVSPIQSPLRSA